MKQKIVDTLMWIPLVGIIVGITQIGTYNSWFGRMPSWVVFLNSLVNGLGGGLILGYGLGIQF